jgi:hypothetical protein
MNETMKHELNLKHEPTSFKSLASAKSFASKSEKLHLVLLGPNDTFLVAIFADANKMVKAGFEIANF